MEIKVNIPTNDYVQPSEVRQEVVQTICDAVLSYYMEDERRFIIKHEKPTLFIGVLKPENENKGCCKYWICSECQSNTYDFTRIRGCEMRAAFKALVSGGYYIYGYYNSTRNESYYVFSKKPVFNHSDCHINGFNDFID